MLAALEDMETASTELSSPSLRARFAHRLAMHTRVEPFRISGQKPLVSFTFDDAPVSALTTGAAILDERRIKGTFYIAGGLAGKRTPDWQVLSQAGTAALHAAGHEIGCHTFAHTRADKLNTQTMLDEVQRNRRFFDEIDPGLRVENFAFPYGYGSVACKKAFQGRFNSSRSIMNGVNHGDIDLQFLRATPLIDIQLKPSGVERALDTALETGGWLIFYTHDVATRPTMYGCSPALMHFALAAAEKRGIACVSINEALQRIGAIRGGTPLANQ